MLYLHPLCRVRFKLIRQIIKRSLTATLLSCAFLPLTKHAALAASGDRSLTAAPVEQRVLTQRAVVASTGPRAQIAPPQREVTQGENADFISRSVADPDVPINSLLWTGPSRQTSRNNRFVVETAKLRPGSYEVTLTVIDKRQRQNQAVAKLIVKPQRTPGGGSSGTSDGPSVESRPPVAKINPDRREVMQGDRARFVSNSRHPDPRGRIIRYAWTTEWGQKGTGESLDVDTHQLRPGRYRLRLEITDQRELRAVDAATLVVFSPYVPPPPPDPPNSQSPPMKTPPPWRSLGPSRLNQAPMAKVMPEYLEANPGEAAFFDGRQSRDPDGRIVSWSWRVDGEPLSRGQAIDINTLHLAPGKHRISLEVTDDQGLTGAASGLLIVKQPTKDVDVALVELQVMPAQTPPNRQVQITAVVANKGKDLVQNVKVRFEVGETLLTETLVPSLSPGEKSEAKAKWLASSPGEHTVAAKLDPDNRLGDINKTNNSRTRAIIVSSPAVITISPNPLQVNQGEKAEFVSHASFTDRSAPGLKYMWRGPGARIGHSSSFQLDTSDIPPGTYQINLEVSDSQGSITTKSATLVVAERRPEVWVTAENQDPETGEIVKFTAGTKPNFSNMEYKFIFGDGKETDWSATPEIGHSYEKSESYTVQLIARRAGVIAGQTSTAVRVKETPYSVILKSDPENVRAGDAVTFSARVEPPVGDVEYQFRFGDGGETAWTRAATTTHAFSRRGTYTVMTTARIRGTRLVQSQPTNVRIERNLSWLWLGIGVAVIAAIGYAMRAQRSSTPPVGFSIVPRVDLASLTVATSGEIDSRCEISVRAARGEYQCRIEVDGALVDR
jgi:PKD repeat protein